MVKRNSNIAKLPSKYLFRRINRFKDEFKKNNPDVKVISLGVGDTTEHLTSHVSEGLISGVKKLSNTKTYSGYGEEQGMSELREKIADKIYNGIIDADEVFISDGAKCDTGRLQLLFGNKVSVAVQDPSYPVYVDGSVIMGNTKDYNESKDQFDGIEYFSCVPKNNFFPDLAKLKRTDLIYFCNPNNPTGATATKEQLIELVDFAKKNNSIIIYDSAYSGFIKDDNLPRSIYEIKGSKDVAIEMSSFSKTAGFTGVRLGWSIVPKMLKFDDGSLVADDWNRVVTTVFNGASNIAQYGGLAVLDDEGYKEWQKTIDYYMDNAKIIKSALKKLGYEVYGGDHAPYIWTKLKGKSSWEAFEEILNRAHIVCTPGVGFGPAGEGFIRFSACNLWRASCLWNYQSSNEFKRRCKFIS